MPQLWHNWVVWTGRREHRIWWKVNMVAWLDVNKHHNIQAATLGIAWLACMETVNGNQPFNYFFYLNLYSKHYKLYIRNETLGWTILKDWLSDWGWGIPFSIKSFLRWSCWWSPPQSSSSTLSEQIGWLTKQFLIMEDFTDKIIFLWTMLLYLHKYKYFRWKN